MKLHEICGIQDVPDTLPSNKVLIDTCLRWCHNEKIMNNLINESMKSSNMAKMLDCFIDTHLFFLPIPRYERPFASHGFIGEAMDIALDYHKKPKFTDDPSLNTLYACFLKLYPHISVLRTNTMDTERHALLLMLMALDPINLQKVDTKQVYHKKFIDNSYLLIHSILNETTSGPVDALQKVSAYLIKNTKTIELPASEPDWIAYTFALQTNLINGTQNETIVKTIDDIALQHNISKNDLIERCALKNLIDEQLVIGFSPQRPHEPKD